MAEIKYFKEAVQDMLQERRRRRAAGIYKR